MTAPAIIDLLAEIGDRHRQGQPVQELIEKLPSVEYKFEDIFDQIRSTSLSHPQKALSIALGVRHALKLQTPDDLQNLAQTSWMLAWAANQCADILSVQAALDQAEKIFSDFAASAWLAACLWQRNTLPWTTPSIQTAVEELEQALDALQGSTLDQFTPYCRMSLINAYLMVREFDLASQQIANCREELKSEIDQGRLELLEASLLRRSGQYEQAIPKLKSLLAFFDQNSAPIDRAQVEYQLGVTVFSTSSDYPQAEHWLTTALNTFEQHQIDLWAAACRSFLGQIYVIRGFPGLAADQFDSARKILLRYDIRGMLADNYNDSGQLALHGGDLPKAARLFSDAAKLYTQLGLRLNAVISEANLADAYTRSGRYQQAIAMLEAAAEKASPLGSHNISGVIQLYLGRAWLSLNQVDSALEHLRSAEKFFQQSNQPTQVAEALLYQAEILISSGDYTQADERITKAVALNIPEPVFGIARHLLAKTSLLRRNYPQVLKENLRAAAIFEKTGMEFERADTLLTFGDLYQRIGEHADAEKFYQQALEINQGVMPEITWRAEAGLGELAKQNADLNSAYTHFLAACETLFGIRQRLWQPSLSAGLMAGQLGFIDEAVLLSKIHGSVAETTAIIEGAKATALNQAIGNSPDSLPAAFGEVHQLRQEITYLQHQLRLSISSSLWQQGKEEILQLRRRLQESTKRYAQVSTQAERRANRQGQFSTEFSLDVYRRRASNVYPEGWAALDYHLTPSMLTTVLISEDRIEIFQAEITPRARLALDACQRRTHRPADLASLGDLLFPPEVRELLHRDQTALIAPHRSLHHIPWAGLTLAPDQQHLIEAGQIVISPSLQTSFNLMQIQAETENRSGLVIGVANHSGYPALPQVVDEVAWLESILPEGSAALLDDQASWDAIQDLAQQDFGFLHLATHLIHDPRSGWLSRIILADEEIWVDQLSRLAPLPPTVMLSACSGLDSFVLAGDEQIGFPSASLAAGARTVIGSQRPILDEYARAITAQFYGPYLSGVPARQAFAQALRSAIQRGIPAEVIGEMVCFGLG